MKVTAKVLIIVTILLLNSTFLCACGSKKKPDTAAQPSVFEISSAEQEEASPGGQNDSAADQKASTDKDAISELLAKGSNINEICYDLIIIGAGISSETKVWFKNKKMKIDSLLNGKRTFYIFDLEKDEIISYLPGEDMATKQRSYEYTGTDSITPMDLASFLNNNDYKLMGTQTVNGMECQLLTVNTDEGNFKLWLSKNQGLVVKFEQTVNGQTTTSEYKNIKIGAGSVPDAVFALPKNIRIIDLNDIMSNVAGSADSKE